MEPYIGIGIIVAFGVAVFVAWRLAKRRVKALQELAASLNFSYAEEGDGSLLSLLGLFLPSRSDSKTALNVMRGRANDIEIAIMDYRHAGKNGSTQTAILLQSARLQLPSFELMPNSLTWKTCLRAFGLQDISFESHLVFSKHYMVLGKEEAVRTTFNDGLLSFFERRKGLNVVGSGESFLMYQKGKMLSVRNIRTFMEKGFSLLSLLSDK